MNEVDASLTLNFEQISDASRIERLRKHELHASASPGHLVCLRKPDVLRLNLVHESWRNQ